MSVSDWVRNFVILSVFKDSTTSLVFYPLIHNLALVFVMVLEQEMADLKSSYKLGLLSS